MLVDIEPNNKPAANTLKADKSVDTIPSPTPATHASSAGTFEEFKAMLGVFASLETTTPGHKVKKPFLGSKQDTRDDEYVSVCMAVKDQGLDLPECKSEHTMYMQEYVYNVCVEKYRNNHTWMAFLDADEYLEMTGKENLNQFLEKFENDKRVGAVYPSWMTHSSAGLLKKAKSVRKAYIDCIWDGEGHNVLGKDNCQTFSL
ncbi:hypothetical protein DID88_006711 [Monilinia fructigena]|uniref:Glycosyltransferase family 92 protein n=1 Tax=Monilinia fructigena TaxID=38457 RepID=A0A395IFM0_9HELO|nr:hypothetical protein DID88_006711 [Monilinia fructigena]